MLFTMLFAFERCTFCFPDISQKNLTSSVANSSVLYFLQCYLYRFDMCTVRKDFHNFTVRFLL